MLNIFDNSINGHLLNCPITSLDCLREVSVQRPNQGQPALPQKKHKNKKIKIGQEKYWSTWILTLNCWSKRILKTKKGSTLYKKVVRNQLFPTILIQKAAETFFLLVCRQWNYPKEKPFLLNLSLFLLSSKPVRQNGKRKCTLSGLFLSPKDRNFVVRKNKEVRNLPTDLYG